MSLNIFGSATTRRPYIGTSRAPVLLTRYCKGRASGARLGLAV